MAEKGAWFKTQKEFTLEDAPADWSADQKAKQQAAKGRVGITYLELLKNIIFKMSLGTDLVGWYGD